MLLNQNFVNISHRYHACYMPRLYHSPWSDHLNNIWRIVKIIKQKEIKRHGRIRTLLFDLQWSNTRTESCCRCSNYDQQ
jgi:hypothetical protein